MPAGTHITFSKQLATAGQIEDLLWVGSGHNGKLEYATKVTLVTDKDVIIYIDGIEPDDGLDLKGSESWNEDNVQFRRLRFVNQVMGERPTVRGIVWG